VGRNGTGPKKGGEQGTKVQRPRVDGNRVDDAGSKSREKRQKKRKTTRLESAKKENSSGVVKGGEKRGKEGGSGNKGPIGKGAKTAANQAWGWAPGRSPGDGNSERVDKIGKKD